MTTEFPAEFDERAYRSNYPDLQNMSSPELVSHFHEFGIPEGRRGHSIVDRVAFAQLLNGRRTLEIGPFTRPLLAGPTVAYADILSTEQLSELAPKLGLNAADIPKIDWVISPGDLSSIDEVFDAVISGHVIEHQPNLVGHLQQVADLLPEGGVYFALIPDLRYSFDHFMPESTISEVLDAFARRVVRHDPRSLIASRLTRAHNDSIRHWSGDHGDSNVNPEFPNHDRKTRLEMALAQAIHTPETLSNEHAWFFTPHNFRTILEDLASLSLTRFRIERLYPTLANTLEFWAILRKV
jgi:SAM-dependent methyltransferase